MDIVSAFEQVGTYRAAAALCGTTHKTVRRVIEARAAGEAFDAGRRPARARNTDGVRDVIAEKVRSSDGRISAKRLLPVARAAGYVGFGPELPAGGGGGEGGLAPSAAGVSAVAADPG